MTDGDFPQSLERGIARSVGIADNSTNDHGTRDGLHLQSGYRQGTRPTVREDEAPARSRYKSRQATVGAKAGKWERHQTCARFLRGCQSLERVICTRRAESLERGIALSDGCPDSLGMASWQIERGCATDARATVATGSGLAARLARYLRRHTDPAPRTCGDLERMAR